MQLPVILLVPGAWHSPASFLRLTDYLSNKGYVVESISLASVGASQIQHDFTGDVEAIRASILKHADQGSDIILFFHSYAGIPGSSACHGLLKSDRQTVGKLGGVVHLIYCAAFMVDQGVSVMDGLGGNPLPWFVFAADKKTLMPATPVETFYNDIHDDNVLAELVRDLKPQSYGAFWSKSTYAAWKDVSSTYVVCESDEALPPDTQRNMIVNARQLIEKDLEVQVVTMDSSHSPFVSQPGVVGEIIARIVQNIK